MCILIIFIDVKIKFNLKIKIILVSDKIITLIKNIKIILQSLMWWQDILPSELCGIWQNDTLLAFLVFSSCNMSCKYYNPMYEIGWRQILYKNYRHRKNRFNLFIDIQLCSSLSFYLKPSWCWNNQYNVFSSKM